MFLSQFVDPLVLILLGALVISVVIGLIGGEEHQDKLVDAAAVGVILFLNALLGFIQEFRAEKALAALKTLTAPRCNVIRDGKIMQLKTEELVPGDLVLVSAGDKAPADGRLIDAKRILVDESSLTGESVPVDKQIEPLIEETRLIGEKRNMVYLGTSIVKGRGAFIVTETGKTTELGRIAQSLASKPEKTPLQKDLQKLGSKILFIVLGACAVVFLIEIFKQLGWVEALIVSISLAVAAIPEGLPAAVTISLALGVRRMAERNSIVRRLHAVETLGATTFICTDKTGTLTENRMRVEQLIPLHPDDEGMLLRIMVLCNDTRKTENGMTGDPTETALFSYSEAKDLKVEEILRTHPRVDELAFDSDRKMMTTLHHYGSGYISATKGAPEQIIERSSNLDTQHKDAWLKRCEMLSTEGFRLLGFAMKEVNVSSANPTLENNMRFLGIVAESDPPRAEVPHAIKECYKAGINVAMITGDHLSTAKAIGARIGLTGEAVSGEELDLMSEETLHDRVQDIAIYARVSPLQKVKILEALKYRNHVVAMTGDGVNDAPALKRADIGISMGITGTDVAVEASQMVLTDDNFATIVSAIRQGRLIFENIKKFVHFLLSCNISEVLTVLLASIIGMPLPLLPLQILWVNLVTDGLPALALGSDKPTGDLMGSPPRKKAEGIVTQMGLLGIVLQGLVLTVGVLGAYALAFYLFPRWIPGWLANPYNSATTFSPEVVARTVAFSTLVLSQLIHAFNFRVGNSFLFSRETLRNLFLDAAFLLSLGLQAAVLYIVPVAAIFKVVPLNWPHLVVVFAASLLPALGINFLRRFSKIR